MYLYFQEFLFLQINYLLRYCIVPLVLHPKKIEVKHYYKKMLLI